MELKKKKYIRAIGVSGLPLSIFPSILKKIDLDVILTYNHYHLIDQSLNTILPFLKSKHIGVINASPLGMGLMTHKPLPKWHSATIEEIKKSKDLKVFCKKKYIDLPQQAILYSTMNKFITSTLVGMPLEEEVNKNIESLNQKLDKKLINYLDL